MKNNKKGFTIVELVIVIAVIAILAAVLIPTFTNVINKANESAAMQECRNEWTAYLADNKDNVIAGSDAVLKKSSYYFAVVDGSFKNVVYESEAAAAAAALGSNNAYTKSEDKTFPGNSANVEVYIVNLSE